MTNKHSENKSARIMPRVSKATGGFAPGITSLRDIEELEDREYAERMGLGRYQAPVVDELNEDVATDIEAARHGEAP